MAKAPLLKVYMRKTGDVLNENAGTVQEHYVAVARLNGIVQIDSVMAANYIAAQRKVCMEMKTLNIRFVDTLKEAIR